MREIKLYAHHVEGVSYTKANAATPFRALTDGSFEFREQLADTGVVAAVSLEDADIACLPAYWSSYDRPAQRSEAVQLIERADRAGQRVAIWVNGDHELDLPWANVIQFQHAFRRSRSVVTTRKALPVIFSDIVLTVFDGDFDVVPKGTRPTVGFCGQARSTVGDGAKRLLLKGRTRVLRAAGRTWAVPEPMRSHVALRRHVLDRLAADDRVDTNFIIRDRYRAGLTQRSDRNNGRHAANMAFFGNIRDTQYTVCVRGGGNFSVRLYETLCLGRIPLIVDSDGILPWPDHPFWRETALVVPASDLATLGDRLLAHHAAADEAQWIERQHAARAMWLDWLSRVGYLSHLPELLEP